MFSLLAVRYYPNNNNYIYLLDIYLIPLPWGKHATIPRKETRRGKKKEWIGAEAETIHPDPGNNWCAYGGRRKEKETEGKTPIPSCSTDVLIGDDWLICWGVSRGLRSMRYHIAAAIGEEEQNGKQKRTIKKNRERVPNPATLDYSVASYDAQGSCKVPLLGARDMKRNLLPHPGQLVSS